MQMVRGENWFQKILDLDAVQSEFGVGNDGGY